MDRYVSSVSTKGQVTLPAAIRRFAGINPGDKVVIAIENGEIVVRRSAATWRDSYRSIPALKHPVSLEQMTEIAAEENAIETARADLNGD